MSSSETHSVSRSTLGNIDDPSSPSRSFAAFGDVSNVSSSLNVISEWAYTNARDTPSRGNQEVQAWVNQLCIPSNACRSNSTAALEGQLGGPPALPLGEIAIDEDDIIIAVMGITGAGKSTFVNRAVGRPDVGADHDTKEMRPVRYPHSDGIRNIVLVDTPGFDDTFMTDAQVLRHIAHWLNATYKNNIKLCGVLYLHRISDSRVSGTSLRNYNMFKELCGKENFKNVILVTTMWDEVTEEVGSAREKELQLDFWRSMISMGSTIHRFEGTMESAWKILNSLSVAPQLQRRPLQIQREMVDEHVPLHRTAAGKAVMVTLSSLMSGVRGVFKRLTNSTKGSPGPIPQGSKRLLRRTPSLLSMSTITTSSGTSNTWSVRTGIVNLSGSRASAESYRGSLFRVIPALQAALGLAELVRIPHLKDVISPSLSIALSIETMAGAHQALFQVLEIATLLINVITERAKQGRLPADMRAAIKDFAKQMSDVQGIVQDVAQRQSETRQVLQSTDIRVIVACTNSMRLVCDILRSMPSLRADLRAVDDGLGELKRSLEIASFSCGMSVELAQPIMSVGAGISLSRFTENNYVIFVVDPAGAGKSLFVEKLFEDHDIRVVEIREHVKVLMCNLIHSPVDIAVISIPSHTGREDCGAENTVTNWLKSSFSARCQSGILLLHSLDSDPTDSNMLMVRQLDAFTQVLSNKFPAPSRVYVVPTTNLDISDMLIQRSSYLKNILYDNGNCKWHASIFPGIFKDQPEMAWSATLLLLNDIAEIQANGSISLPIEPALKRMPLPNGRLALQDLADLLFKEFRKKRSGDSGALITLARTVLDFTPPEHPRYHSALINLADVVCERFKKEDTKVDLDEVIGLRRAAWECMLPDEPGKDTVLLELHDCLDERFRREDAIADLEEIISLRRSALERSPPPNRCRQLLSLANALHEKFRKQGLVDDINEAVNLASAALGLCSSGDPDHALSQDNLASYLQAKLGTRGTPAHASDTSRSASSDIRQLIKQVFLEKVERFPLRLLHTPTGILCSRDAQLSHFESSFQYKQLLLSTSACGSQQLETEISDAVSEFFGFAMLSHRWGRGEPSLQDIEGKHIYELDGTEGLAKLQDFCILAFERNFQWSWSDTCCIDKDSNAELQEAIGSMFSWYRQSSLTIVYLSDVSETGSLAKSVWFERGWTLQELLAPHTVLFYTHDWSLYMNRDVANHKTDPALLEELHEATEIEKPHLTNFCPGMDDVRTGLRWASRRRTSRPEDIAYSLFGMFGVHLPVLYGESAQQALGRLLAEIISRSGDVSVLDWVGQPSSFNSCFPADLAPYHTIPDSKLNPCGLAKRTDLDFDKTQKLCSKLAGLPLARFVNSKLILPSIIYPVTTVMPRMLPTIPPRYTYEIRALHLMPVNVTLSVELGHSDDTLILVRPWDPKSLEAQNGNDENAVWKLLEQLQQPFNALLLKRLPHNEYKRIASDCTITARIQDLPSIFDSEVLVPQIV